MAEFYGTVQGNRSEATRGGSKDSGIRASAQSYEGSVVVNMYHNNEGVKMVRISIAKGSSNHGRKTLYHEPLDTLMKTEVLIHILRLEVDLPDEA